MMLLTLLINGFLALAGFFYDRPDERPLIDTVILYGTSMDQAIEKGVKSDVYLYNNSQLIKRETTDSDGAFRFEIPRNTTRMVFRSNGFYANEIPVYFVTNGVRGQFSIKIPLIRNQKPCIENKRNGKTENVLFRVKNAMTGEELKAKICVMEGSKQVCAESTDRTYPFSTKPGIPVKMTVSAEGYQPVQDVFCPGNEPEITIGLMRLTTAICLSVESARKNFGFVNFERRNSGGENFNWATGDRAADRTDSYVEPGIYDLTFHSEKGEGGVTVSEDKGAFTINAGLNFLTIVNLPPTQPPVKEKVIAESVRTKPATGSYVMPIDSTSIFFRQSDYILPAYSQLRLDSVLSYLKSDTNLNVVLTGHTENIGNRDLNLTLSEYRTKVVASYLRNKGIAENRIRMNWMGPDFLLRPGNVYRGSNQRVEVRIK